MLNDLSPIVDLKCFESYAALSNSEEFLIN